ncbi:MAG: coproporphyrinogen-III oxidase family protein, partial [Rhodospirillales bacterium]|nr:coproporphyrinogen-III oxidase family protein [Rhodospirillales bacterium]
AAVLQRIKSLWSVSGDFEVTAEANPSSAERAQFEAFRAAGVNRLSLGMQSLSDESLVFLGRRHTSVEARRAAREAAQVFDRYSLDFIYALPGQTSSAWRSELDQILTLAGGHLSLYQLSIEPGTQFHRDRVPAAGEDAAEALFDITRNAARAAGLVDYEISNHSLPGQECRHNLVYWRGEDYLGIGPGAHGRLPTHEHKAEAAIETVQEIRLPSAWLTAVQSGDGGTQKRTVLSREERFEEILLMGLRLTEGIDFTRFERLFGAPLMTQLDTDKLGRLIDGGFLEQGKNTLSATTEGRQRLNAVLAALLT